MSNTEQMILLKNSIKEKKKDLSFYTKGEIVLSRFFGEVASDLYQKGRFKELKGESDVQSFLTPPPTGTVFNCLNRKKDSANPRQIGNEDFSLSFYFLPQMLDVSTGIWS